MSGAGVPPGWYPDPSDTARQRYWDGAAWSEATAPGAQGYAFDPAGGQQYGAPGTMQVGYGYAQAVGAPLAGFWIRFGAMVVDSVLLSVPSNLLAELVDEPVFIGERPSATFWLVWALSLVIQVGYFAYFEGTSGQTVGKRLCGIHVVDADTLEPGIGVGRGLGRHLAHLLSAIVCLLGYFWMLWDPQKQTWHDKLVRTKVVRVLK